MIRQFFCLFFLICHAICQPIITSTPGFFDGLFGDLSTNPGTKRNNNPTTKVPGNEEFGTDKPFFGGDNQPTQGVFGGDNSVTQGFFGNLVTQGVFGSDNAPTQGFLGNSVTQQTANGFFGNGNGQQFDVTQGSSNFFGNQPVSQGFQQQPQYTVQQQVINAGQQGVNQGFPISNAFPTNSLPPIFG